MAEHPDLSDLSGLRSGATGEPASTSAAEQLAEQRRARGQLTLADTWLAARDSAMAYRAVMGDRREREQAADSPRSPRRNSTHL